VSVVRVVWRDGEPTIHVRPGDPSVSRDARERELGELHDDLKRAARSGELDDATFFEVYQRLQAELARRDAD
jgi:hypothetical protein